MVEALLRANLAGAAAVLAVLALRPLVRRVSGAEDAYGLWALPLAAAGASLLPARMAGAGAPVAAGLAPGVAQGLLWAWLAGVLVMALWLALAQWRFQRRGQGPAVVGVIAPRLLMPPDDGYYSPEERALIRAHERQHIARGDPAANAVLAVVVCLAWFNPLAHLAVRLMRLDQELACDAAVVRQRGGRAAYALALVKAQLAAPPPLGALWGAHPLEARIAALARRGPEVPAGPGLLAAGMLVAAVAWACQPAAPHREKVLLRPTGPEPPAMSVLLIRVPPQALT